MGAPETDDQLIGASLTTPGAFAGIFDRHGPAVFAYLARRAGATPAEDLLGEVFRVAFERRSAYRADVVNARPWLFGIATNVLHRHRRREVRHLAALGRVDARAATVPDFGTASAGRLDDRALLERVGAVLAALPAGERDALLLYAWEDLSYAEIAVALDVPVGTVRSRINRARSRITSTLGANDDH